MAISLAAWKHMETYGNNLNFGQGSVRFVGDNTDDMNTARLHCIFVGDVSI